MRIVVFDFSKGTKTARKSKRILSSVLHRITPRIFIGNCPERVILQLDKKLHG